MDITIKSFWTGPAGSIREIRITDEDRRANGQPIAVIWGEQFGPLDTIGGRFVAWIVHEAAERYYGSERGWEQVELAANRFLAPAIGVIPMFQALSLSPNTDPMPSL